MLKKIHHANVNQNKAAIVIPIEYKLDFKVKSIMRDIRHITLIKGSIQQITENKIK